MAVDMDGYQSGLLSFFAKEMLLQNNHRFKSCTILHLFLGSSMVEHLAVNQRVASSSLAPRATWKVGRVWFIASVLKTVGQKCSVSSNLTLSSSRCINDTIATIHMVRHCITEWLSQGIVIRLAYIVLTLVIPKKHA